MPYYVLDISRMPHRVAPFGCADVKRLFADMPPRVLSFDCADVN